MTEPRRNTEEDYENEIDLREIAMYLLRWIWLILGVAIISAGIAYLYSAFVMKPVYVSTTKIYVLSRSSQGDVVTYADTQLSTVLAKDYKELIKSRYVLEAVIEELNLNETYEQLSAKIDVSNAQDTRVISISVEDYSPARAQRIANAVREMSGVHIQEVMDMEAVNVVDEANLPTYPSKPSKKKVTMIGFLIGAALVVGALILKFYLDDSIKTSDDVKKYLDIATLAVIPQIPKKETKEEGNLRK